MSHKAIGKLLMMKRYLIWKARKSELTRGLKRMRM